MDRVITTGNSHLNAMIESCRRTGCFLLEKMADVNPEMKGGNDLVSAVDRTAESMLIEDLERILPEASILSEERGWMKKRRFNDLMWVIDPLDGTVNYASQIPLYAISVALIQKGELHLAVAYSPPLQELYYAEKGRGAAMNGCPLDLRQSSKSLLRIVATSAGMFDSDFKEKQSSYHATILPFYNRLRLMGSQVLHLCFVAAGRIEVAMTNQARLWDDAAGALILKEAHGSYTDFQGNPIFPLKDNSALLRGQAFQSIGARSQGVIDHIVGLLSGA